MGKKQKRGQKQTGIPHKEAFQRMNYLYQAAMAALSATPSEPNLSRFYIRTMKTIGKRLVLRIDPSIKRKICKSCDSLLVPGVTCTHRLKSHRQKHVVITCLTCGALKRFLTNTDYRLWSERVTEQQQQASAGGDTSNQDTTTTTCDSTQKLVAPSTSTVTHERQQQTSTQERTRTTCALTEKPAPSISTATHVQQSEQQISTQESSSAMQKLEPSSGGISTQKIQSSSREESTCTSIQKLEQSDVGVTASQEPQQSSNDMSTLAICCVSGCDQI